MSVPPALTITVPQLNERQRRLFFWGSLAGLLWVLGAAARVRFSWAQWPVADPDTWGYLHPGLAKLRGEGFQHTYGRNFLYPGWVYLWLREFGDFRAVSIAQHLLGLATGGLLWTLWRQWRAWLTEARLPAWADAALGLALVAFFVRSASVLHFEAQIRPEAIFPFFAALDGCLLLAFLRAWFVDRHPLRAALRGGASVFVTALLYQLKPSFGLAVGFALLPILWAFLRPWTHDPVARRRLGVCVALAGGLSVVLLLLPERHFAKVDEMSQLFLPETLLTVHARIVRDQMAQDARDGAKTPFAAQFLADAAAVMDKETDRAAEPAQEPYPSLGYNPDHLMYRRDSFCRWLYEQGSVAQTAAFCFYYYQRAALHHPLRMSAKVGGQLGVFYNLHCPAFWPALKFKEERLYRKTTDALAYPNYQQQLRTYPPGAAYLEAAERRRGSSVEYRQPPWTVRANVAAAVCYLPVLVLFAAGMVFVSRWSPERRAAWWAAGWLIVLVHGLNFGNCLTIAVVHSLDVARYGYNLLVYAAFCELAALVWLVEVAVVSVRDWKEIRAGERLVG